ncbi:hypothetical protein E4K10_41360 [Streptomyces sp. T1317-0309]|nr:hypothetical protein E4K10_41360 [Streptomyces sp. T1317-0309]
MNLLPGRRVAPASRRTLTPGAGRAGPTHSPDSPQAAVPGPHGSSLHPHADAAPARRRRTRTPHTARRTPHAARRTPHAAPMINPLGAVGHLSRRAPRPQQIEKMLVAPGPSTRCRGRAILPGRRDRCGGCQYTPEVVVSAPPPLRPADRASHAARRVRPGWGPPVRAAPVQRD